MTTPLPGGHPSATSTVPQPSTTDPDVPSAAQPTSPAGLAGAAAASAARRARADLKRQVEFSGESLRRAVTACAGPSGTHIRRMPVVELLAAMPGVGARRAAELAQLAGVAPGRRLGGLGQVQLETLARIIDERATRRAARRAAAR